MPMEALPDTTRTTTDPPTFAKKIVLACAIGNFVEWFDFTLYGFSATVIATVYFPPGDRTAALLAAFAVYGVTFLARPIGAVFFGRLGDRRGRRTALAGSITVMGAATAAIGLLPGYQTIGLLAPVLLVVCRLAQGFSAGGEYTGVATYVTEHAPRDRVGFWLTLTLSSTFLASAAATATVLIFRNVSDSAFVDGGWRWPFVIGGLLAVIGLYLRLKLDETPVFAELAAEPEREVRPFGELLRRHGRTLLVLFVYFSYIGVLTHTFLGYIPSYLDVTVGVDATSALVLITVVQVIAVALTPLSGIAVDRFGRRPLLRIGALGGLLTVLPSYLLIGTGNPVAIGVGLLMMLLSVLCMSTGLLAVMEIYPADVRYSGTALPYNVAYAALAGTAPLISEALVTASGNALAPAFYGTVIAAIACPIIFRGIPETRHASLRHGLSTEN
jgi:MFS transporter, MHS family, proline/betaine transporter